MTEPQVRRFEAVVLVGWAIADGDEIAARIAPLLAAHADVGIVGRGALGALTVPAPDGPATLLLADDASGERATVDRSGVRHERPSHADGRLAALARTAELVQERLAAMGFELVRTEPSRVDAPVVTFRLANDPPHVPSRHTVADVAAHAAQDVGLLDPSVTLSDGTIAIAVHGVTDALRWTFDALWRRGLSSGSVLVVAHEATADAGGLRASEDATLELADRRRLAEALDGQLAQRRRRSLPAITPARGWALRAAGLDLAVEHAREASFTLADGHFGATGASIVTTPSTRPALFAGRIYDGEGPETHLLQGPVAWHLFASDAPIERLERVLDLRTGVLHAAVTAQGRTAESVRFASLARPGTLALRADCPQESRLPHPLSAPVEATDVEEHVDGDVHVMRVTGSRGGIVAAAADVQHSDGIGCVLERFAAYVSDPESRPPVDAAIARLREARDAGYDRLLAEHRAAWAERWENADVVIEGDDELQCSTRFALFHLMASVPDAGEAALGARGLSGTSYRGHVFWDADAFALPFFAATHPPAARAMLEYRIRRLPAAREEARQRGRNGARFPWESAWTGHEVTPPSAVDRTGTRRIIRTGLLEEHIVADVAWAASCYVDWTGDAEFARGPGATLLVETARYWASRIRVDADGVAHIYGVIGPDEYHEGVDDNAFTNVMARWNLRKAAAVCDALDLPVDAGERARWRELAGTLVDGFDPNTGLYEQFAGFYALEPLIIEEIAPRRPIAADYLLGAERVRGAHVLKQADVLMLHHLVPDEVVPGSLEPNLRFYEPRTAHGSSLSPAIHASLLARARHFDRALPALRIASRIDLDDLTGSTGGGIHVATMGGLWQALVFGFAGIRPCGDALRIDPRLPPAWSALEVRLRFRGTHVLVRAERASLHVVARGPLDVTVGDARLAVPTGGIHLQRAGMAWEVIA